MTARSVHVVFALALGISCQRGPQAPPPDVFLISVDTLRRDHLGVYGYGRPTSPAIDRLAADAVVFDSAFTPIPKTSPALLSLLSGLEPRSHRMSRLGVAIDERILLLPEVVRRSGYETAGFCGQFNCSARLGFDRGFDHYSDELELDPLAEARPAFDSARFRPEAERRAEEVVSSALDWLRSTRNPDRPALVWLHLMDPHAAYAAPTPWTSRFDGAADDAARSVLGDTLPPDRIHPQAYDGSDSYRHYLARYDAEIAYTDAQIGRFLDELRATGVYDRSIVVLTADHGEFMGENRAPAHYFGHGDTLTEAEIRVPLLFKLPANRGLGSRRPDLVSLIDVAPTILELAGLGGLTADGSVIVRANGDAGTAPRRTEIVAQLPSPHSVFALRLQRRKVLLESPVPLDDLVESASRRELPEFRLLVLDLKDDPLERRPRGPGAPVELPGPLRTAFLRWLSAGRPQADRFEPRPLPDDEVRDGLRSLGYLN